MGKVKMCDGRCHNAKGVRCTCWCNYRFHGAEGKTAREAFVRDYGLLVLTEDEFKEQTKQAVLFRESA